MMPLIISLREKHVLIVGGGEVGERKAKLFYRFAGEITILSKRFSGGIKKLAEEEKNVRLKEVDIKRERIEIVDFIKNSFLVVIATDSRELNEKIAKKARSYGKLVNRVSDGEGDVIVPSIIKKEDILVSISTSGKSPAMAKFLKERIECEISERDEKMVKLQDEMRSILKEKVKKQRKREEILSSIIKDEEIWDALGFSHEKAKEMAIKKALE